MGRSLGPCHRRSARGVTEAIQLANDVCALPLVRRMAALLDRDPASFATGDPLPHGWHVALFNPPTRQSQLRTDGAAQLGVELPDLGMPRLMMGGRRIDFIGEIPIGASVRRVSRAGAVTTKTGKSGQFALVDVEHQISVAGNDRPVLVETTSYVLRKEVGRMPSSLPQVTKADIPPADIARTFTPNETMLFRYSAITDNPHRIHYDLAYARSEGYPALVVNGTVPTMLLLEMFREHTGGEPAGWHSRNLAPMLCGSPLTLTLSAVDEEWVMRAHGPAGEIALDAKAWR